MLILVLGIFLLYSSQGLGIDYDKSLIIAAIATAVATIAYLEEIHRELVDAVKSIRR